MVTQSVRSNTRTKPTVCFYKKLYKSHKTQQMNKISGKELNLLKTLEILKSNRFISFYHFNNLSKREWDTIKLQLRKIETQEWFSPVNDSRGANKDKKKGKKVSLLERTAPVQSKISLLVKQVNSNSLKDIKSVTTKKELKGAQVELLVLKSKAVVKALYPFLFNSQRCQEVEQTVDTYPQNLRAVHDPSKLGVAMQSTGGAKVSVGHVPQHVSLIGDPSLIGDLRDPSHQVLKGHNHVGHVGHQVLKQFAEQNTGKPFVQSKASTSVGTKLGVPTSLRKSGHVKEKISNVSDSLLPEKSACQANNQLGFTLNPTEKDRINSLINAFYLIEGPTLLVGASTIEGFKESGRQLEKEKNLVFVGGVLENQFINHLDLKDCLKTFLPTSANLLQTFSYSLMIPPLNYYSNKLLFLFQKRQESLKKKEV